jgi:hypothetical protein
VNLTVRACGAKAKSWRDGDGDTQLDGEGIGLVLGALTGGCTLLHIH